MAGNRIQIRRGNGEPPNGSLMAYELGWDYTNKILYIVNVENNAGIFRKIGGEGAFLPLTGGTLTGNLTISNSNPILYVQNTSMDTSTTTNSAGTYNQIFLTDKSGKLNGFIQGCVEETTARALVHFGVRTRNSANNRDLQQHFSIIMAKDGTASTFFTHSAAWRAGLSVPAMVTTESYPALLPTDGTNNWIKVGTANTLYGLLPSQSGGAGSGHNSIGTASWYWGALYCDQIYSILNTVSRSNHSADVGIIVQNTDSTNPLKLGYIIGTSGNGGIYDYTHSAWKVQIAPGGNLYFNSSVYINPNAGNWSEGIRIKPYGSWATILLGGNDLTADSGTTANSWSIHNNNGTFCIARNGSNTNATAYLTCVSNKWSISGNITSPSASCSWISGQNATNAAFNVGDATNTGSYWPWMRQTNTSSAKWFSFGTLNTSFYWIGSATSRTDNGYDQGMNFDVATGKLLVGNAAVIRDSGTTSRRIFVTTSASVPSGAAAGDIVLVKA